ncbi:hypothetical protein [Variovorax sp. W2I14]|uniref:hypothetical protein n=1 Tax=Variovorax sp. W2I14 TaxID=3042290 RepID=UPI003D1BDE8F
MEIKSNIVGDKIHIHTPYELKDLFRDFFKTAKFDFANKFYWVKNTTANQRKLATFEQSFEVQKLLKYMRDIDDTGFTVEEVKVLNAKVSALYAEKRHFLKEIERTRIYEEELKSARKLLDKISATVAKTRQAAATAQAELRPTFKAMLTPYNLDGKTVVEVLADTLSTASLMATSTLTDRSAEALQRLVVSLEWLKDVQAKVIATHQVNFAFLAHPLTAAHVASAHVKTPEAAEDWLYSTALISLPTTDEQLIELERSLVSLTVEEVKPAKARFKI